MNATSRIGTHILPTRGSTLHAFGCSDLPAVCFLHFGILVRWREGTKGRYRRCPSSRAAEPSIFLRMNILYVIIAVLVIIVLLRVLGVV